MLIRGYPDDQTMWDELGKRPNQDYRVVSDDVRGSGESGAPVQIKAIAIKIRLRFKGFAPSTTMAEIDHALVGFDLYASDEVCYAGERLMLHAELPSFSYPLNKGYARFYLHNI